MRKQLFEQILAFIEGKQTIDNKQFNDLALKVFEYQFKNNSVYQQICLMRQNTKPQTWQEIPCLTTDLFKTQKLFCLNENENEIAQVFYSSGTTKSQQSKHYLSELELKLYEASLWQTFKTAFKLDEQNFKYLVLSQSPQESPNSSLIYMFESIRQKLKANPNCYFIQDNCLQTQSLIYEIQNTNRPILLVGTAFSFVHFLDQTQNLSFNLPSNSAIMETGGFKGKSREIVKEEFYALLCQKFNLPKQNIVGQYGMSELGTQYYDFSYALNSPLERYKKPLPWTRVRIVKPSNLQEEVEIGETGLICHYDLTNLDSLAFVLSGDLGLKQENNSFEIIGRAKNLMPKGCSLTTDLSLNNIL